jgi:hypothetical protein
MSAVINLNVPSTEGNILTAERLLVSQEGLCSVEPVMSDYFIAKGKGNRYTLLGVEVQNSWNSIWTISSVEVKTTECGEGESFTFLLKSDILLCSLFYTTQVVPILHFHVYLIQEFYRIIIDTHAYQVKVTLRPTISRPVRLGVRRPSGTRDQFFYLLEIFV